MAYQPKSYRKFLATSVAAAVVVTAGAASVAGATKFSDVPANHFAVDHINYLVEKGAISGYADGTFKPNASITRAELSRILVDTLGLEVEENVQLSFTDTRDDAWYAPYVAALADKGIIQGNPDGTFAPGKTVTRAELAIMVVAAYELEAGDKEVAFPDVKENVWYTDAINTLASNNIVVGKPDGSFAPGDAVTRGEATAFVHRTEDPTVRPGHEDDKELTVESVTVVDATTLTVVLSDDTTHEVTLEEALEANVETEVTFEIDGVEYTATVTWEVEEDGALAVESVSAITASFVEVNFAALTEAQTDVTVEVKNDKGVVVPVVAQDLAVGQTSAQFDFVTAYTADLEGVWTVNGTEFSFVAIELLQDILDAVTANNQVALLEALNAAEIKNVNADLIANYLTDIAGATSTPETLADVQAIINETNTDSLTDAEKAAVVEALEKAKTQVAVLNVLQDNFTRVNSKWIVDYVSGASGTGSNDSEAGLVINSGTTANQLVLTSGTNAVAVAIDYDDIQDVIDTINAEQIDALDDAADTAAKQSEVTSLIQAYVADDEAPATTKADAVAASQLKTAAFRVAESTTQNNLYNNLVALANLEGSDLVAADLNTNLRGNYFTALDTTAKNEIVADPTKAVVKREVVDVADTAALTAALTGIEGITTTTTTATTKSLLQKLADVTAHTGDAKFDISTVVDTRLVDYRDALEPLTNITQNDVETAIAGVNGVANQAVNLATIKDVNATVAQVRTALTELAAGTTNATTTAYLNASSQVKLEVAKFIVDNRANLATGTSYNAASITADGDTAYSSHAIGKALADHAAKVAEFNAIGDLAVATISGTKAELDTYAYAPYVALSTSQKLAVAEEINKLTKPVGNPAVATPLDFTAPGNDSVTTLAQANAYIDAAIAVVTGN